MIESYGAVRMTRLFLYSVSDNRKSGTRYLFRLRRFAPWLSALQRSPRACL